MKMSARKGKKTNARLPFKVLDIRAALGMTPGSKKRKVSENEDEPLPSKTPRTDDTSKNYTVVLLDQDEPDDMIVDVENMPVGQDAEPPSKRSQHFMQKYLRVSLKKLDLKEFQVNNNDNSSDQEESVNTLCQTESKAKDTVVNILGETEDSSLGVSVMQSLQGTESNSNTHELSGSIKDLLKAPIKDSPGNDLEDDMETQTDNGEQTKDGDCEQVIDERPGIRIEKTEGDNSTGDASVEKDRSKSHRKSSCDTSFEDTGIITLDDDTAEEDTGHDSSNKASPTHTDKSTPKSDSAKKRKRRSKEEIEKEALLKAARKAEKQRVREAAKQRKEEERQKLKEQKEQERAKKIVEREKEREEKRQKEEKEKAEREKAKKEKDQQREDERLEKLRAKEVQKLKKQLILEAKLEEKKKKEDERLQKLEEKKKQDEEMEKKKQKARDAFVKFFLKPQQQQQTCSEEEKSDLNRHTFKPFEVRKDMTVAPTVPVTKAANFNKDLFEDIIKNQKLAALYLEELRSGFIQPFRWLHQQQRKTKEPDSDVIVVLPGGSQNTRPRRPKLLQFHSNVRPPYWGTWSKSSNKVGPRKPFGKDEAFFDYEIDSDDEWEEEEPGESLSGTEDEKEPEDDYEIDNEFMVPHGYLSPEEEQDQEEPESPEALKLRLKMKEQEFKAELTRKCPVLQPFIVGCIWMATSKDTEVMEPFRMVAFGTIPIATKYSLPSPSNDEGTPKVSSNQGTGNETSGTASKGNNRKYEVPEEAMPHLLRLIHANTNGRLYLIREFKEYWSQQHVHEDSDNKMDTSGSEEQGKDVQTCPQSSSPKTAVISKRQLEMMFQKIATWLRCPDPAMNKFCWWVHEAVREKYGLLDLPVPNQWQYTTEKESEASETNQTAASTPSIKLFAQVLTPNKTDVIDTQLSLGQPNLTNSVAELEKSSEHEVN